MTTPTHELRPKTLKGIKSLAKRLKKDRGIKHYEALEAAARQAGFQNFHDAREKLGEDT